MIESTSSHPRRSNGQNGSDVRAAGDEQRAHRFRGQRGARPSKVLPNMAFHHHVGRFARLTLRQARRIVVLVLGGTLLLLGIVMIVLPGPAFVVIPLGLAVLALEFTWARRWLRHIKQAAQQLNSSARRTVPEPASGPTRAPHEQDVAQPSK